jgi:hypothetical protein
MLPLHLQMEIDLSAREHSQKIAEGFADARQKLLGDPPAKRVEWAHPAMNRCPSFGPIYSEYPSQSSPHFMQGGGNPYVSEDARVSMAQALGFGFLVGRESR